MKLIANKLNGNYLSAILPGDAHDVDGVYAAIAYGSQFPNHDHGLFSDCVKHGHRLDIWMRYDHTVPVAVPVLKELLNNYSNNIFCTLIPDCLHSKVIWWKGYGAYIGSANHTDRAWYRNIEAGLFLDEEDLQSSGMALEIEEFFDHLVDLDKSFPLTEEIVEEMEKIQKQRDGLEDKGFNLRSVSLWEGPSFLKKEKAFDRRKEAFRSEWHETLTVLRSIGETLKTSIPKWVESEVPLEWQTDQFLHAYYYNKVSQGRKKPFEEFHRSNRANPKAALDDAVNWWKNTDTPPSNEDRTFNESAPFIRDTLKRKKILNITQDELSMICRYTHATKDHIIKLNLKMLGEMNKSTLSMNERIPLFSKWLLTQKNSKGWDVRQLLNFVLYDGDDELLWERLYLAARTKEYGLPHYGLNSMAEVVGWTRPEIVPPRNGRTSKALRALGYEVRIY